jgi:hypothetical protein
VVNISTHPLNSGKWVEAGVRIRQVSTGEVRELLENAIIEEGEDDPSTFIWEDGNYACDCNREIFFNRAIGEDAPDRDCGDGAYLVQLFNPVDGSVYYDEFVEIDNLVGRAGCLIFR